MASQPTIDDINKLRDDMAHGMYQMLLRDKLIDYVCDKTSQGQDAREDTTISDLMEAVARDILEGKHD